MSNVIGFVLRTILLAEMEMVIRYLRTGRQDGPGTAFPLDPLNQRLWLSATTVKLIINLITL